ncbi:hypothetical protein JW926_18925 [Candidatus Sumerlaeota bacterium]|nr:hypothetical protein [Candidatus Sumerlaeota bacterium]
MKNKKDKIPDNFSSYEEAGEFWDTHDSTHYLDQMTPVKTQVHLKNRHYEIEIDEDVIQELKKRSLSEHIPSSKLANDILRKQLLAG